MFVGGRSRRAFLAQSGGVVGAMLSGDRTLISASHALKKSANDIIIFSEFQPGRLTVISATLILSTFPMDGGVTEHRFPTLYVSRWLPGDRHSKPLIFKDQ
jgi:hypothetical protein